MIILLFTLLLSGLGFFVLLPFVYIGCGIYMSRTVSRVVEWSEHHASLADIARVKRELWFKWPIEIPLLAIDILTVRDL